MAAGVCPSLPLGGAVAQWRRCYQAGKLHPAGNSFTQASRLMNSLLSTNFAAFFFTDYKDVSAGELINPSKTFEQVDKESREGHDLYIVSHNDYYVDYPVCGVPTIHSDIPAPQIHRISDRTDYGDEANAYALLFPSVFSQKGVYEGEFLKTRPKAEIAEILCNIGVNISGERFEHIWKQA